MERHYKIISHLSLLITILLATACANTDYLSVIPENSTAIVSLDTKNINEKAASALLHGVLGAKDANSTGIDFSQKLYAFETADGNFGFCARIADSRNAEDFFNSLANKSRCSKVEERDGLYFTDLNNSWAIAFSDEALVAVGPITASAIPEARLQIAKWFKQDEGIAETRMFETLDSITAPIALVAQAQALPDKFAAPLTIGAPKDADPSEIMVAAGMKNNGTCLEITGRPFSFDKNIDKSIKESLKTFRSIKGTYASMPEYADIAVYANVEGGKFLKVLQSNKSLQALLAGINTAIDMDNIIRSFDGDMAIYANSRSKTGIEVSMGAEAANASWLKDVDYWRESCPSGCKLIPGKGCTNFIYQNGDNEYCFGISNGSKNFYFGSNKEQAEEIKKVPSKVSAALKKQIQGERFVLIADLAKMSKGNGKVAMASNLLKPIFGNVKTIKYTLR